MAGLALSFGGCRRELGLGRRGYESRERWLIIYDECRWGGISHPDRFLGSVRPQF